MGGKLNVATDHGECSWDGHLVEVQLVDAVFHSRHPAVKGFGQEAAPKVSDGLCTPRQHFHQPLVRRGRQKQKTGRHARGAGDCRVWFWSDLVEQVRIALPSNDKVHPGLHSNDSADPSED